MKTEGEIQKKDDDRLPLPVVLGPTAVGKTDLSLQIAKKLNCEIISADSMQIYHNMDIGTAKVSPDIRKIIPHHMIDIISPEKEFSVAEYQKNVDKKIKNIVSTGKIPLMVGGTGLYIKAVVKGFLLPEMEKNQDLRQKLRKKASKEGNRAVHKELAKIDPRLAEKLHPNDLRRVIRGIEIYHQTGKTKTYFKKMQQQKKSRYKNIKIGLTRPRKNLYQRINQRVDKMMARGLMNEVKKLYTTYDLSKTALQALGYKEIIKHLDGEYNKKEAVRRIKRNTRHLAKKQLTWFKRDDDIYWFDVAHEEKQVILPEIISLISEIL